MRNVVFGEKQFESTRKGDHASWMMANMGLRESGWRSWNGMEGGRNPGRFIGLGCVRGHLVEAVTTLGTGWIEPELEGADRAT